MGEIVAEKYRLELSFCWDGRMAEVYCHYLQTEKRVAF